MHQKKKTTTPAAENEKSIPNGPLPKQIYNQKMLLTYIRNNSYVYTLWILTGATEFIQCAVIHLEKTRAVMEKSICSENVY